MKKAFALIELIVSVAIIALFSALAIPQYNTYNNQLKLKKEMRRVMSVIELAKKKALSSDLYDPACGTFEGYRVTIVADSFSLIFLCDGSAQTIQTYNLDNNISITNGMGNFNFPPIGANINIPVSPITIKNSAIEKCLDIDITSIGIISIDETFVSC